jgi:hypothetical protein
LILPFGAGLGAKNARSIAANAPHHILWEIHRYATRLRESADKKIIAWGIFTVPKSPNR